LHDLDLLGGDTSCRERERKDRPITHVLLKEISLVYFVPTEKGRGKEKRHARDEEKKTLGLNDKEDQRRRRLAALEREVYISRAGDIFPIGGG